MVNILLITSYHFPDNHVASWRWYRLITKLSNRHINFKVISADNNIEYPEDRIKRVSGLYEKSYRKKYSRRVRKGPISDVKKIKQNSKLKTGILKVRRFGSLVVDFPDFSWRGYHPLLRACEDLMSSENKIDLIIATHPYVINLRVARELSKRHNIPWIADMRDGWSSNLFSPYLDFPILNKFIAFIETQLLKSAAAVVCVNEQLASTIKISGNKRHVISNAFNDEVKHDNRISLAKSDGMINITIAGGIKEKHSFKVFLEALSKHLPFVNSRIRINYYGRDYDRLSEYSRRIGLPDDIIINNGYQPLSKIESALRSSDFLLIFGWTGELHETYTSGKLFDYLQARKPIIAVASKESSLGSIVLTTKTGFVVETVDETSSLISLILNDDLDFSWFHSDCSIVRTNQFSVEETSNNYFNLIMKILNATV